MLYARIDAGVVAELIDVPTDGPPLDERFHPDIVAACVPATDGVDVGWTHHAGVFAPPVPPPAPPAPPARTLKSDVWRRATDAEATAMDAMLNAAPVRMRRLWADSTILNHDAEDFAAVRDPIVAAFGQARADELLAPSPGV